MTKALLLPVYILFFTCGYAQNLPSLLSEKNINATFSVIAFDSATQEWGIAVATNNIYVGNSTIYIEPGLGAFSVIAETEPSYARNGFEQLRHGKTIQQAIEFTRQTDTENYTRQVSGIDARGDVYAFTGAALQYWQGTAAHKTGEHFAVMGNQLADSVLAAMAFSFENATGTLAEKLLKSLTAGQQAGGQITGKQSAALVVKGTHNEWFNQIDLRVDDSKTPFEDLQKLLNYHYGRIVLNQSLYAIRAGNRSRGETLLHEAETLTEGWNGIYGKIVMAYILLGNENKAAAIIQKAMAENPLWIENVPVFYCLYHRADINQLKKEATFTVNDWQKAVQGLINVQQKEAAITLATRILKIYPSSSYIHYLLGKAWLESGKKELAITSLSKALAIDRGNAEARQLLTSLFSK